MRRYYDKRDQDRSYRAIYDGCTAAPTAEQGGQASTARAAE